MSGGTGGVAGVSTGECEARVSTKKSYLCTVGWVEFQLFLTIGSKPMAKVANTLEYQNLNYFLI